jgi:5-hydroxyisourate hydrolase
MNITTHILDTGRGKPAFGVPVRLLAQTADGWVVLGEGHTDGDGRVANLLPPSAPRAKIYRLFFDLSEYKGFYPYVEVTFTPQDDRHHHVPLLLSPYGYSTYRGS